MLFYLQDCEDHAVLLCSFLLGFGLNSYVCVGTKAKGAAQARAFKEVFGLDMDQLEKTLIDYSKAGY